MNAPSGVTPGYADGENGPLNPFVVDPPDPDVRTKANSSLRGWLMSVGGRVGQGG